MLERQLELDRLKNQTEDLARRKPTTPGVDTVQMQMSDLCKLSISISLLHVATNNKS